MENGYAALGLVGALAVVLAAIAWMADRRRIRRSNLDRVGWVPWTGIFFLALLAAVILLGFSARAWLAS